jgi:hypothetical protein
MPTVTLTDAIARQDGTFLVKWADGSETELASPSQIDDLAQFFDEERTKVACLAYLRARSPNLTNLASVRNKDFIFDLSAQSPIKVQ